MNTLFFSELHALLNSGQAQAARRLLLQKSEALNPETNLDYWFFLAAIESALGNRAAAINAAQAAVQIAPSDPLCHFNLGVTYATFLAWAESAAAYAETLAIEPIHRGALLNYPSVLAAKGEQELSLAIARRAVEVHPEDAYCHLNLAERLLAEGKYDQAVIVYQAATDLAPQFAQAKLGLSLACAASGDLHKAYQLQREVRTESPAVFESYKSPLMGVCLTGEVGPPDPATVAVLITYAPIQDLNFKVFNKFVELFKATIDFEWLGHPLSDPVLPFLSLGIPLPANYQLKLARNVAAGLRERMPDMYLQRPARRRSDQKITLAYLSANFDVHPNVWLMGDTFARHDRENFRVLAFSIGPRTGSTEQRAVAQSVDLFVDASSLPEFAIAQRILHERVDILVDLCGYTRDTKPGVLTYRPAPIQVRYLDFPGTLGMPEIDYAILDHVVMHEAERPYWDEQIAYLPTTFSSCVPVVGVPECDRKSAGLPETGFVIAGLCLPKKLEPETVRLWLLVMQAVPESVLWLLSDNPQQEINWRAHAESHGVDPARLIFAPCTERLAHVARYQVVDVSLDPVVFNGVSTVVDSLSMGTPVVTLMGRSAPSRCAASLLYAHGVPELVALTEQDYVQTVVEFYAAPERLAKIKARCKQFEESRLFDAKTRARELESAYRMMWARHVQGLKPADFDVPPIAQEVA